MAELLLGIKDRDRASETSSVLEELGYRTRVVHTWKDIQREVRAQGIFDFTAVVLDSRLVQRSVRNTQDILNRIQKGPGSMPYLIAYMAEPLQSIADRRVRDTIQHSDYVLDDPATPRSVFLAVRSLKRFGSRRSLVA